MPGICSALIVPESLPMMMRGERALAFSQSRLK